MMGSLEAQFDHVILDTPPILGFADSVIVSRTVDGVILVVSGGRTPRDTLQRAKEVLLQVNAKILGVVINRVDIQRGEYGYYYYRYHYYYGKEGKKKKELPYTKEDESVSA
jgi:Mrp family chromosome partitioning ATPase